MADQDEYHKAVIDEVNARAAMWKAIALFVVNLNNAIGVALELAKQEITKRGL